MNPQKLMNDLNSCTLALSKGNTELKTLGLKKAQTERNYRVALAQEILKLKVEKYPATLIIYLAKGNEKVAGLRLERDIAESSYFVALDAVNNLRSEIEILRSKLTWLRTELSNS
jgi:hypothetical protein